MWQQLDDERWRRVPVGIGRGVTLVRPGSEDDDPDSPDGVDVTMQRWRHADGRLAMHVSDADPELLVLDGQPFPDDGRRKLILREYDLPGRRTDPDAADPLTGGRERRVVAAPVPDDDSEEARWALLRGWS